MRSILRKNETKHLTESYLNMKNKAEPVDELQRSVLRLIQERDQLHHAAQKVAQALDILARLGHAPLLGNSNGNLIAQEALAVLEKVGVQHDGS